MITHVFRQELFWHASLLNVVYIGIGVAVFRVARQRGLLLNVGE